MLEIHDRCRSPLTCEMTTGAARQPVLHMEVDYPMRHYFLHTLILGTVLLLAAIALISCSGPQPLDRAIRPVDEQAYATSLAATEDSPREAFYTWSANERGSDVAKARASDEAMSTTENPFDARHDVVAVSRGAVIYKNECMDCHGENVDGRGPLMPVELKSMDFHRFGTRFAVTLHGGAPKAWFQTIQNGTMIEVENDDDAGKGLMTLNMPGYRDLLAREQIWLVITYLQSLDADLPG